MSSEARKTAVNDFTIITQAEESRGVGLVGRKLIRGGRSKVFPGKKGARLAKGQGLSELMIGTVLGEGLWRVCMNQKKMRGTMKK